MMLKKKLAAVVISMVLSLTFASETTQSKTTPYMERINVNWDLRPDGVFIPYQTFVAGIGYRDAEIGFERINVKRLSNDLINVKFKCVVREKYKPSKKDIHMIANSGYDTKQFTQCSIVDYDTGRKIIPKKVYKWNVKTSDKRYSDSHGCNVQVTNGTFVCDLDMEYPKDGLLCVVAGGATKKLLDDNNLCNNFNQGIGRIGGSGFVAKQNSQVAHAMKIKVR